MNTKKLALYRLVCKFLPESRCHALKSCLLRWCGARVGKGCEITSSAKICGSFDLVIGNNCYIGIEALLFGAKGSSIVIDDYAKVGTRAIVVTGQHRYSPDGDCIAKEGVLKDVRICRGAVCSTQTVILPGKTVGEMSHVAPGAVVTKDVPPYTRVAGVPAKVIKDFREGL